MLGLHIGTFIPDISFFCRFKHIKYEDPSMISTVSMPPIREMHTVYIDLIPNISLLWWNALAHSMSKIPIVRSPDFNFVLPISTNELFTASVAVASLDSSIIIL